MFNWLKWGIGLKILGIFYYSCCLCLSCGNFSFQSLAGLGRKRRVIALLLRSFVVILMILALAGVQSIRKSDSLR